MDRAVHTDLVINDQIGLNGDFANQIFQYIFLLSFTAEYGGRFDNRNWMGEAFFNVQIGSGALPDLPVLEEVYDTPQACPIERALPNLFGHCLHGYFQNHQPLHAKHRALIQQHLSFKGDALGQDQAIEAALKHRSRPLVALHLRQGDFGTGIFFRTPNSWAQAALQQLQAQIGPFDLYIATNGGQDLRQAFEAHTPLFCEDLVAGLADAPFLADWQVLRRADVVLAANSSFSFTAAMLNETSPKALRPSLHAGGFIPFDPWADKALLTEGTAEQFGPAFMSERAKSRTKYRLGRLFGKFPTHSNLGGLKL